MFRLRLLVVALAIVASGCGQPSNGDASPTETPARPSATDAKPQVTPPSVPPGPQILGGFAFEVTSVERRASMDMADLMPAGAAGFSGTITPLPGSEYLVAHLRAVPAGDATEADVGAASFVDATGAAHESMITKLVVVRGKEDYLVPLAVSKGTTMKALRVGTLDLAMPAEATGK